MGKAPTNPAVERARWSVAKLNDSEFAASAGRDLLSEDFVRLDRRPLFAQPPMNGDEFISMLFEVEGLTGTFPRNELTEALAVRGERLAVYRLTSDVGDATGYEMVDVVRFDAGVERCELLIRFEPEQLEMAITELDRLHAEIEDVDRH